MDESTPIFKNRHYKVNTTAKDAEQYEMAKRIISEHMGSLLGNAISAMSRIMTFEEVFDYFHATLDGMEAQLKATSEWDDQVKRIHDKRAIPPFWERQRDHR